MAVIKPKRSGTASSTPTTSDLADGEFAVNSADQKIYIRSGTSVVEVGNVFSASEAETLTNKVVFGKLSGISNQGATKTITVTVASKTVVQISSFATIFCIFDFGFNIFLDNVKHSGGDNEVFHQFSIRVYD